MGARMDRPEYVPPEIWQAAQFLTEWNAASGLASAKAQNDRLRRLLHDGAYQSEPTQNGAMPTKPSQLGPVWQRIVEKVEPFIKAQRRAWFDAETWQEEPDPQVPYRLILAALIETPGAINPGLATALKQSAQHLEAIAKKARELAAEWQAFSDIRNAYGIEWSGSEYDIIDAWAKDAHCEIGREHWRDQPELADLLGRLASATEAATVHAPIGHEYAEQGYGGENRRGELATLVRALDSRLAINSRHSLPTDFRIETADLARLLSCLLLRDVQSSHVSRGR